MLKSTSLMSNDTFREHASFFPREAVNYRFCLQHPFDTLGACNLITSKLTLASGTTLARFCNERLRSQNDPLASTQNPYELYKIGRKLNSWQYRRQFLSRGGLQHDGSRERKEHER